MNYWIETITSSVKFVQLTYFRSAAMGHIISLSLVKEIKCSLFGNTDIESVLYLATLAILNEILKHYTCIAL